MQSIEPVRLTAESLQSAERPETDLIMAEASLSASPGLSNVDRQQPLLKSGLQWSVFWLLVWMGTSLSGAVFGLGIGCMIAFPGLVSAGPSVMILPVYGGFLGLLWAGGAGLLVVPTLACLCWIFGIQGRIGLLAAIAGGLTGTISMPFLFLLTLPIGSLGGWLAARVFRRIVGESALTPSPSFQAKRFNFTIRDLLLRTMAVAILISYWLAVIELLSAWFGY